MYEIREILPLAILFAIVLFHVSFVVGFWFFKKIKPDKVNFDFVLLMGVCVLLGYGLLGYLSLFLSSLGPLNKPLVAIICLLILVLGRHYLVDLYKNIWCLLSLVKRKDVLIKLLLSVAIFLFVFYLISALVPPYRIDALAYHLPEAMQIAQGNFFSIGGFGNMLSNTPKLMESLYALAYVVSGFALINLVHYQILLVSFLVIFSFLRKEFNATAGLLAVILIFSLYELLVNATSPYVDAATVALEVSAILFFFTYLKYGQRESAIISGILYGLALSTKYLPFYSLVIVACLFVSYFVIKKENRRAIIIDCALFGGVIVLFGGFWYVKNWIVLGNPLYPFIFSHVGFTDVQLAQGIHQQGEFIPRTLFNFVLLPIKFFFNSYYSSSLLAFFILPFSLLVKDNKKLVRLLLFFTLTYFSVWFFAISHQKRFGMVGIVFLMIVASIVISYFLKKYRHTLFLKVVAVVLVGFFCVAAFFVVTHKNSYFIQVKKTELGYVFGKYSVAEFYSKREKGLGETYQLSEYINKNFRNTTFWILWDDNSFFIGNNNTFLPASIFVLQNNTLSTSTIISYLQDNKINYIITKTLNASDDFLNSAYVKNSVAETFYTDLVWNSVVEIDKLLPQFSSKIYEGDGRVIYKINR